MSKKHSSKATELDLQVVSLLQSHGIFNHVRANTLTNLANEIQSTNFDSMKCYKTIRTDSDYKIANELVFEYLTRNKMEITINCIQTETENKLHPTQISNDIQNDLDISEKENVLHHVLQFYKANINDIFNKYHDCLINEINERINNIGKKKQKVNQSPKATTAPISQSNSNIKSNDQNSKTQNPVKKEESSSIDLDLNDDDILTPSKTNSKSSSQLNSKSSAQNNTKSEAQNNSKSSPQKIKSESSDLVFDDLSDFDKPTTTSKPAATTQPAQSVKKVSDSEFTDFDDDDIELGDNASPTKQNANKPKNDSDNFDIDFDDNSSPPKQNKSPNQSRPKNEIDYFDDDQEPPLMANNNNKNQAKNDDDSLQDFDDDSL